MIHSFSFGPRFWGMFTRCLLSLSLFACKGETMEWSFIWSHIWRNVHRMFLVLSLSLSLLVRERLWNDLVFHLVPHFEECSLDVFVCLSLFACKGETMEWSSFSFGPTFWRLSTSVLLQHKNMSSIFGNFIEHVLFTLAISIEHFIFTLAIRDKAIAPWALCCSSSCWQWSHDQSSFLGIS